MDEQEQAAFLYEIFHPSLPKLAPGSAASTRKALDILFSTADPREVQPRDPALRILDIGCGNGASTIQLAGFSRGSIQAVDNHQPYLEELSKRSYAEGFADRIRPVLMDMRDLRPEDGPFDLIWSEGALYVMGFGDGLSACHSLLGPGGMLGASELCWLRPDPSEECLAFFEEEYPAMRDVASNMVMMEDRGYAIKGHFILPASAWWEYYHPLEWRLAELRKVSAADPDKLGILESAQREIDIYRRFPDEYGYAFFLMKRP